MAGSALFSNLARGAKVLALLLFFLPWVTISCSPDAMRQAQGGDGAPQMSMPNAGGGEGIPVAKASGLNMALGQLQMAQNAGPQAMGGEPGGAARTPEVPMEIGVIAGAALILLALLGSFLLKGAAGALAGVGGSVLAICALCYSVFISYPPAVRTALAASNPSGVSGQSAPTPEQVAQILAVKTEMMFFLVLFVLALAALFNVLAMRKPSAAAAAAPAAPVPPPTEPPPPAG